MPIHKNVVRQKGFTFTFNGTYTRQTNADSTSYLGIVQDFVTGVTDLSINADVLPLTFSGVSGGTERVDNSEDNLDRWVINCMNNTDDVHEYSAEDVRDSALAALQNTTWHDFSGGLGFTPTQLGTWTAQDEVYATHTTYDLAWTPNDSNTTPFANDHPVGLNPQHTVYINVADNFTPTEFTTDFSPLTAILDVVLRTVTLTASSASNMVDNQYWAVGRKFGTNENGSEIPQWVGTVSSRTTETDGSSTIVLDVDSGLQYLNDRAAAFLAGGATENNIEQLFTTGRHFVVLINNIYLYMVDQINNANEGYTVEGVCTEDDINGNVIIGVEEVTQTGVEINFGSTLTTGNNLNFNLDFPDNVINSLAKIAFNTAVTVVAGTPAIVGPFGGRMFVQANNAQSQAGKVTDWAKALNEDSRSLIGATVSGTHQLRLFYKDGTTNITANPTITGINPLIGGFNSTQPTSTETVNKLLSLVDDPNRVGSRTGILLIDDDYVSRTTDYNGEAVGTNAIPNLTFARGSTLTLGNGFKLDIGKGYDFTGDGKDVTIIIEGNAKLSVSGQAKENLWGAKQKRLTEGSTVATVDTVLATPDNPLNVIQRTGGSLVMNLDTSLDAPVTTNRTFLYGNSVAQSNGRIIWTVDNGSTGFYNSPSFGFVYTMQGAKIGQTFDINSPTGTTIYVPIVLIKQFTGDTINIGNNNSNFQFSASYQGTNATDILSYEYSSIWVAYGFKLLGNTPTTLEAYNPTVNYLMVDVEDKNGIYSGGWNFTNRPTNSKGVAVLGRLWNPSWTYSGNSLTKIYESYYYGTGIDETTLVAVKEGCESSAIGTAGTNNHPFSSAVEISNTQGLADVNIDGEGINKYKSRNLQDPSTSVGTFSLENVVTQNYIDIIFTESDWSTAVNFGIILSGFSAGQLSSTDTTITALDLRNDASNNIGTWDGDSPRVRVFTDPAVDDTAAKFVTKIASVLNNPRISTLTGGNTDVNFSEPADLATNFFEFTAQVVNSEVLRLTPRSGIDWSEVTSGTNSPTGGTLQPGFVEVTDVVSSSLPAAGQLFKVGDLVDFLGLRYECILSYTTATSDSTPNNDSVHWSSGANVESWGDTNDDRDGLVLTFTKGDIPNVTELVNVKLTATPYDTDWFCYSRRDGFRPRLITEPFNGSKSSYQSLTAMEPFLDLYWQSNSITEIDAYVTAMGAISTPATSSSITTSFINQGDWNDNYRFIEHHENVNSLVNGNTGDEERVYDSTNSINGAFRRLIDIDIPVNSSGLMNINQGDISMEIDSPNVTISTDAEAIRGIDAGTQDIRVFHSGGATVEFTGVLTTTGSILMETSRSTSGLTIKGSTLNAGTMTLASLTNTTGADNVDIEDSTITATTVTFGGTVGSLNESSTSEYLVDRTVFNVTNAISFPDDLDTVSVNTTANITLNDLSENCLLGSNSQRAGIISFTSSSTATNNTGYGSSVVLPQTVTGGLYNVTGTVTSASTSNACSNATITGSGITLVDLTECIVDGLTSTLSIKDLFGTTSANCSTVTASGVIGTGSDVTATGNISAVGITGGSVVVSSAGTITSTASVSDSTITASGNISAVGITTGSTVVSTAGTVTSTGNVSNSDVTASGNISAVGIVSGSTVVSSGTVTSTGNVSDSTVTAPTFVATTAETSVTGETAIISVTTSATILTLGE